jgi:hypothetical protein
MFVDEAPLNIWMPLKAIFCTSSDELFLTISKSVINITKREVAR